jgi:hypothetical protein
MTQRERLPNRRQHVLINFTTVDGFRYTAGLGYFDDGRLAEIFLNTQKIGTAIETTARDSAVVASLALQHGVPPETIRRTLTRNCNGSASLGRCSTCWRPGWSHDAGSLLCQTCPSARARWCRQH